LLNRSTGLLLAQKHQNKRKHYMILEAFITSLSTHQPAIFLDRDGTINVEKRYLNKRSDWEWEDGAIQALSSLKSAGFRLIIVSNQAGIARGYYTINEVNTLHSVINEELRAHNCAIDAFVYCPHHPEFPESGECDCRKPSPKMITTAASKLNIDLKGSWMIGDKNIDVQAGVAAGVQSILIGTGYGTAEAGAAAKDILFMKNLKSASEYILEGH
jgi:D-glycero-D-manno-heptose 1,7-bisphosphate phosphatase